MPNLSKLALVGVLVCAGAGAAHASAPPARELGALPPGEKPIVVTIGAYLIDLERIEESNGACSIDGYLDLEWVDPRLSRAAGLDMDRSRLTVDEIWWPNIEFYNQYDPRSVENVQLVVKDDGTVTYEERFRARLGCDLDFRRFPFDRQDLPMRIESFAFDTTQMIFKIRTRPELRSAEAFLPDWFVLGVRESLSIDRSNPDRRPYAAYTFTTTVKRKAASYMWNTFVPLALITILSWVVFWIRNRDFTNITITTLVAAVAFAFVVSGNRPHQYYMTFMDALLLSSYVIIFLANVVAAAVHHLDSPGRTDRARGLERVARWVFPLLYVLLIAMSVGLFFGRATS